MIIIPPFLCHFVQDYNFGMAPLWGINHCSDSNTQYQVPKIQGIEQFSEFSDDDFIVDGDEQQQINQDSLNYQASDSHVTIEKPAQHNVFELNDLGTSYIHNHFIYLQKQRLAVCRYCQQKIELSPRDFLYTSLIKHLDRQHDVTVTSYPENKFNSSEAECFTVDYVRKGIVCLICLQILPMSSQPSKFSEHLRSCHPEAARKISLKAELKQKNGQQRLKRSIVWKIFQLYKPEGRKKMSKSQDGTHKPKFSGEIVICKLCGFCIKRKNNCSTAQLLSHFKKQHPEQFNTERQLQAHQDEFVEQEIVEYANNLISRRNQGSPLNKAESCLEDDFSYHIQARNELRNQSNLTRIPGFVKAENFGEEVKISSRSAKFESAILSAFHTNPRSQRPYCSFVWEVFSYDVKTRTAVCLKCKFVIERGQNRSLKPLLRHLERHHFDILWLLEKQKKEGLFQLREKILAVKRKQQKKSKNKKMMDFQEVDKSQDEEQSGDSHN